jgi:hypothetical protein
MLAAIFFFSFFINLEAHDVDLMEARNFVTAREMAVEGHWLIPTMNGELRIAKPPLPSWITAAARIAGLITPYAKKRIACFGSYRFIIIWLIVTLILLSIIPEKKERYLLPAIIPMAILAGCLWRYIFAVYAESRATAGDQQWNFDNQPLPLDNLPIAMISTVDPTQGLLSEYHNIIDVNVLGKYPERSNRRGTVYFVTLISPPSHQKPK